MAYQVASAGTVGGVDYPTGRAERRAEPDILPAPTH
jgi:hypothetical protein